MLELLDEVLVWGLILFALGPPFCPAGGFRWTLRAGRSIGLLPLRLMSIARMTRREHRGVSVPVRT